MGKKSAIAVLAANVKLWMAEKFGRSSSPKLAAKSGVGQRTINNVEKARHDPKLSTIEAIARAFGIEPYQLLCPASEKEFLQVLAAWQHADQPGKELLLVAAETVMRRHGATDRLDKAPDH
jgi:transcriptional regulator with XRE-family HTH domain